MLRLVLAGAGLIAAIAILLPAQWLAVRYNSPAQRRIPTLFHRLVCMLLGVRVRAIGAPAAERPLLIAGNHVSWIDISVVTALAPVAFVAKSEVASWPLFGLFARLQRTVFVERNRRAKTADANAEIARRLRDGDPVVLFAEGTSSDGNRVLPFRSALVGAARDALAAADLSGAGADGADPSGGPGAGGLGEAGAAKRVLIQPLSIAYVGFHGLPMGRQHRPVAAWCGALDLVPHLAAVLRRGAIDVTVSFGAPIAFDAASDRKATTRALEAEVRRLTIAALRGRA
jgi:1-acyl-sn-glycerol-3-phosphate acyltransferase